MAKDKIKLKNLIMIFSILFGMLFVACLVTFTIEVRQSSDFAVAKRYAKARLEKNAGIIRDCTANNTFVSLFDVKPALEAGNFDNVTGYEVIKGSWNGGKSRYNIKIKSNDKVIEMIPITLEAKNCVFGIYYGYKVVTDDLKVKNQKIYTLDGANIEVDEIKIDEMMGEFDGVKVKGTQYGKCYIFDEMYEGKHKIKVYGKYFEEKEYEIDFNKKYKEHYVTDLSPNNGAFSICKEKMHEDFKELVNCGLLEMEFDELKNNMDFYDDEDEEHQSEYRKIKNRFKKNDDGTGVVRAGVFSGDKAVCSGNLKGCMYIKVDEKITVVSYRLRRLQNNNENGFAISRSEKSKNQSITYLYSDGKWLIYKMTLNGST